MQKFNSLAQLIEAIPDEKTARAFMEQIIWGDTPTCPHCYNQDAYKLKNGKTYKCKNKKCNKTFTVTVGIVFEKTHIPLRKWVYAIYLCTVHKTIINQRAEEINKAILELCALVFLHKQAGKNSLISLRNSVTD